MKPPIGRPGTVRATVFWSFVPTFGRGEEVEIELIDSRGLGAAARQFREPWLGDGGTRTAWQARIGGDYFAVLLSHRGLSKLRDVNLREVYAKILSNPALNQRVIGHHAQLDGEIDGDPLSMWITDLAVMDLAHWRSLDPEPFVIARGGRDWVVQGPQPSAGMGAQSAHYLRPVAELLNELHVQEELGAYRIDVRWRDLALENVALRMGNGPSNEPTIVLDPEAGRMVDLCRANVTATGTHFHEEIQSPADVKLWQLIRQRRHSEDQDDLKAAYTAVLDPANEVFHLGRMLQCLAFAVGDRDPGRIVLGSDPLVDRVKVLADACVDVDPAGRPPLKQIVDGFRDLCEQVEFVPVVTPSQIKLAARTGTVVETLEPDLDDRVDASALVVETALSGTDVRLDPVQSAGDPASPTDGEEIERDEPDTDSRLVPTELPEPDTEQVVTPATDPTDNAEADHPRVADGLTSDVVVETAVPEDEDEDEDAVVGQPPLADLSGADASDLEARLERAVAVAKEAVSAAQRDSTRLADAQDAAAAMDDLCERFRGSQNGDRRAYGWNSHFGAAHQVRRDLELLAHVTAYNENAHRADSSLEAAEADSEHLGRAATAVDRFVSFLTGPAPDVWDTQFAARANEARREVEARLAAIRKSISYEAEFERALGEMTANVDGLVSQADSVSQVTAARGVIERIDRHLGTAPRGWHNGFAAGTFRERLGRIRTELTARENRAATVSQVHDRLSVANELISRRDGDTLGPRLGV